jgi:serine/threonine-protein kinase
MASDAQHGPGDIILDRYELVRLLGSGGWGRVYLANDHMLNRPVAIKQLLPRLAAEPSAVSRFKREASVIASIREPHVLTVYDIAERDGQHYMVMEYADAGTLAQVLQLEGAMAPYEALSVAIDVCKGLRAVHSKGVVHRDVKPANVMFFSRPDGLPVAKIGDFGIALHPQDERLTPSDNVVGTLIYLSPEQASSSAVITHLSDLYSLGVVLYEMMNGELREPMFINPLFANGNNRDLLEHLSGLPDPVRPLLIKSLHRRQEDRFQSADEMLQALQRARSRLTVSYTTQTIDHITPVDVPAAVKRHFPGRLLTVAALTLVLLAGGAMATFRFVSGSAQPTPDTGVAVLASSTPTPTDTPLPAPTPTFTAMPSPTLPPSATPTSAPSATPAAPPSPTPTVTVSLGAVAPTRVSGAVRLKLRLYDTRLAPQGVFVAGNSGPNETVEYMAGSYLWGEVETQVGDAVFRIDRSNHNPSDPRQHLPPYLRLQIEYSGPLLSAMQNLKQNPPGFDAQTGEFWVGRFRCGSAVPAATSGYRITVRLLEDGREIARQRYALGVTTNPSCVDEGGDGDSGGPPTSR